jgi:two-component system cell cycle response regulator
MTMIAKPMRVLLVEDNPGDALLVSDALEEAGPGRFELVHVDRLSAALEIVHSGGFDAVLIDLTLPDTSGLDTFRHMLKAAPHLPVIVLSGQSDEEAAVIAVAEGAQDYLIKGRTTPDLLARALRYAVQRKRLEEELASRNAQLAELATTDGLTGLRNSRHFREALPAASSLAVRTGLPLSVVMLDLDRFKAYNDSFGHPAGDDVLRRVGTILGGIVRAYDLAARYGGEEFALLLPATDAGAVRAFAERVRAAFKRAPWPLRLVTASFGLATSRKGMVDGDVLLAEADDALYRAKRAGRDRVVHHDDLPEPGEAASSASPLAVPWLTLTHDGTPSESGQLDE